MQDLCDIFENNTDMSDLHNEDDKCVDPSELSTLVGSFIGASILDDPPIYEDTDHVDNIMSIEDNVTKISLKHRRKKIPAFEQYIIDKCMRTW